MPAHKAWTDDMEERLILLVRRDTPFSEIGSALGVSKNAVSGRVHRLRLAGKLEATSKRMNPVPPSGRTLGRDRPPPSAPPSYADRLADLVAEHDLSLDEAARRLKLRFDVAIAIWRRICAGLGPQAV